MANYYPLLTNGEVGWEMPPELAEETPQKYGNLMPYEPAPGWQVLRNWRSRDWARVLPCGDLRRVIHAKKGRQ